MHLEYWLRDGEYFKGASTYTPLSVRSWLRHAVFCIITCKNSTVMMFRLIIMKASVISMKFMVCNILQMWDVEFRNKHMLAEINLKHTFVLVMEKFHGSMQQFKKAQQCKIHRLHNNLLLLEFDYNVLYSKWLI